MDIPTAHGRQAGVCSSASQTGGHRRGQIMRGPRESRAGRVGLPGNTTRGVESNRGTLSRVSTCSRNGYEHTRPWPQGTGTHAHCRLPPTGHTATQVLTHEHASSQGIRGTTDMSPNSRNITSEILSGSKNHSFNTHGSGTWMCQTLKCAGSQHHAQTINPKHKSSLRLSRRCERRLAEQAKVWGRHTLS